MFCAVSQPEHQAKDWMNGCFGVCLRHMLHALWNVLLHALQTLFCIVLRFIGNSRVVDGSLQTADTEMSQHAGKYSARRCAIHMRLVFLWISVDLSAVVLLIQNLLRMLLGLFGSV